MSIAQRPVRMTGGMSGLRSACIDAKLVGSGGSLVGVTLGVLAGANQLVRRDNGAAEGILNNGAFEVGLFPHIWLRGG